MNVCNKQEGWSNYPTWAIKLWLDNEEATSEDIAEIVEANHESRYDTSHAIREYVEELTELGDTPGLGDDLLGWAIQVADFYEIADAYIQDRIENLEYEEAQ